MAKNNIIVINKESVLDNSKAKYKQNEKPNITINGNTNT